MKILLIYPPTLKFPAITPPLGIAYLKSYIKSVHNNVEVDTIDLNLSLLNRIINDQSTFDLIINGCFGNPVSSVDPKLNALKTVSQEDLKRLFKNLKDPNTFADDYTYLCSMLYLGDFLQLVQKNIESLILHTTRGLDKIIDYSLYTRLFGLESILNKRYDVVGFSALYNSQLPVALLLAKIFKTHQCNLKSILGGAAVSLMPEKNYPALLSQESPIDFLCVGEGELALSKFITFEKSLEFSIEKISNFVYRRSNEIITNEHEGIHDLDTLPFPDFSQMRIFDYHAPYPIYPIITSRGCSWHKCTFCDHNRNYFHYYRNRNPIKVVEEMKSVVHNENTKIKYFSFDDNEIPASYMEDLAQRIMKERLDIRYLFLTRPTRSFNKRILKLLNDSGCRLISYGVESFNQEIINRQKKGTKVKDIINVLKASKNVGILNSCFYFVGFPTQSTSDIEIELNGIFQNHPYIDRLGAKSFVLFRHAEIAKCHDLIEIDQESEMPEFYINKYSVWSHVVPFIMKDGMNSKDAGMALEIIYEVFSYLKGDTIIKIKPEAHMIMIEDTNCGVESRIKLELFQKQYDRIFRMLRMSKDVDAAFNEKIEFLDKAFSNSTSIQDMVYSIIIGNYIRKKVTSHGSASSPQEF